ncbi:MAG: threonylcarbamoyl-AMP synthase [Dehalococcoidia bacterium]|nr:threonylcarbamoyl-AMP synthase [Dehalococcoidia bacterium]
MPATSSSVPVQETLGSQADEAVRILRNGGVAAIPTDTVYGLAAAYDDEKAIDRVFRIKSRPSGLAVPLLLDDARSIERYVPDVPESFWALAKTFWPGPLTIVLRKSSLVSDKLTAGRDTVGLRVPDHWLPRYISKSLDKAITGTSANLSGSPSLTTAVAVKEQLGGAVDLVIDGGDTNGTTASTVVDLSGDTPTILREGSITLDDIEKAIRQDSS